MADLPDGNYSVTVDPTTLPDGMVATYDLDTTASANTAVRILTSADRNPTDVDFSYTGVGSIGDTLFYDVDADGDPTADAAEPPLANVDVDVIWSGPDGILDNGDDVTFSTTTDVNGQYLVQFLPFGSYRVVVDPTSLPSGLTAPTYDLDGVVIGERRRCHTDPIRPGSARSGLRLHRDGFARRSDLARPRRRRRAGRRAGHPRRDGDHHLHRP